MAASLRSSTTLGIGTRSNSSFTKPTGTTAGDLILIFLSAGNSSAVTVTPPSGFSVLSGGPLISISKADPWTTRGYVFYKVATGSEGSSFATSHSSASTDGACEVWSGVDTSSPFNPTQTTNSGTGGGTTSVTATGLTTGVDSSGVIFFALAWDGWTSSNAPTGTTPTFTERFDGGSSGNSYVADGVLATAGATGNKSVTTTLGSNNPWAASLIALAAATGGGGGGSKPIAVYCTNTNKIIRGAA